VKADEAFALIGRAALRCRRAFAVLGERSRRSLQSAPESIEGAKAAASSWLGFDAKWNAVRAAMGNHGQPASDDGSIPSAAVPYLGFDTERVLAGLADVPRAPVARPPQVPGTLVGKKLYRNLFNSVRMEDGGPVPGEQDGSMPINLCHHALGRRAYVRVDSTDGPGWMSDTYRGAACQLCGMVLEERKIY
jgi:hypothetical protein